MWGQGVFEPGGYTLDSLIIEAHRSDFAVLVATPDDVRESRGRSGPVPRDNVVLEFGLFAGVLGRERTFILATRGVDLPTDILGLTRLTYHDQENPRSAVSVAAGQVRDAIGQLGRFNNPASLNGAGSSGGNALRDEITKLMENGTAQGWTVKDTKSALRATSPRGRKYTLQKTTPEATREALRPFAAELRAGGLRVNSALRHSSSESPFS